MAKSKAWFCGFCHCRIWSDEDKKKYEKFNGPTVFPDKVCHNCGSNGMTVIADDLYWPYAIRPGEEEPDEEDE